MGKDYWITSKWVDGDHGLKVLKHELDILEVRDGVYGHYYICDVNVGVHDLEEWDVVVIDGISYGLESKYNNRFDEDYDENHPTSYARLEEGRNHQRIFTPKVKCATGIIYMTVWNTEIYKDYQGHNIVELRDDIKSEHTRKAADWIMETLGEGDHRCIVKVDLIGEDVSFELIDSKTLEG